MVVLVTQSLVLFKATGRFRKIHINIKICVCVHYIYTHIKPAFLYVTDRCLCISTSVHENDLLLLVVLPLRLQYLKLKNKMIFSCLSH